MTSHPHLVFITIGRRTKRRANWGMAHLPEYWDDPAWFVRFKRPGKRAHRPQSNEPLLCYVPTRVDGGPWTKADAAVIDHCPQCTTPMAERKPAIDNRRAPGP